MEIKEDLHKLEILKYSGVFLLLVMSVCLLVSSCFYYFHISLTKFHFLSSILISGIVLYYYRNKFNISKKTVFYSVLVGIIIMGFSIVSMTFIYDRSSDGNTYHKDAIGNLYLGWNPVYQSSSTFVDNYFKKNAKMMHDYDIWKDHYAKANWILEANVYKLTDHIESGKAINLIFMYILFALSFAYFYKKIGIKALFFSIVVTFNPICCNQLFTFYNDQLGASLFFLLVLALIMILDKKEKNIFFKYSCLFLTFPIIANIKFNIMGYAMVFTFVVMLIVLYDKYKEKLFLSAFKKLFIYYLVLFVISFGIIGYSTYIKNYINNGNLFYPVYGEKKVDIITAQEPKDFLKRNSIEKFFVATFASTNNLQNGKKYKLKIPFMVSKDELKESMSIDTRLSGYGVLFSGLLLVSIFVLITYSIKSKNIEIKKTIILFSLLTLFIIIIISESWWARYNPTTYLVLLMALFVLLKENKRKVFNIIFIGLILINSGIILGGNLYYSFTESLKIENDFRKLKDKNINISFNNAHVTGIVYNLKDYDIKYYFEDSKKKKSTYYKYLEYEVNDEK